MTAAAYLTLLYGAGTTMALSLAAIAVGLPLGLLMALARWRRLPVVNELVTAFVSIVRPTPMITLCLFVFFVLPSAGLDLSPMFAALLALALSTAAFNCEIWRTGMASIASDQREAGAAFGMSDWQVFHRIVLPQLWRASLGPLVSEMTLLVKVTPAVSVIGIVDITRAASRIGAQTYEPLPAFVAATVIYTLIIAIIVQVQRLLERRIGQRYGYAAA